MAEPVHICNWVWLYDHPEAQITVKPAPTHNGIRRYLDRHDIRFAVGVTDICVQIDDSQLALLKTAVDARVAEVQARGEECACVHFAGDEAGCPKHGKAVVA